VCLPACLFFASAPFCPAQPCLNLSLPNKEELEIPCSLLQQVHWAPECKELFRVVGAAAIATIPTFFLFREGRLGFAALLCLPVLISPDKTRDWVLTVVSLEQSI
jgi:hypothetical protein